VQKNARIFLEVLRLVRLLYSYFPQERASHFGAILSFEFSVFLTGLQEGGSTST
jgi:hypothetical protein